MILEVLPYAFSVCKLPTGETPVSFPPFTFFSVTDGEASLVCKTEDAPASLLLREDGWRAMRVAGKMDFSLIGILSEISGILAEVEVPVFVVSTYDTDYVLIKEMHLERACEALRRAGHEVA